MMGVGTPEVAGLEIMSVILAAGSILDVGRWMLDTGCQMLEAIQHPVSSI
jgi:hypothetical protein